jgi:polyhydroxyalkanoate synthesis regulator phasin
MSNFPDLPSGAIWAAIGAAVAKGLDFVLARKGQEVDHVVKTYDAVNEGQKQLVESLFQQVRLLKEELTEFKEQLRRCEEQHRTAAKRVDELEHEVAILRAQLQIGGDPATGCKEAA